MANKILPPTSTLIAKIPNNFYIPDYQDKIRVKKTIVRTIIQILQSNELELIYLGNKPELNNDYNPIILLNENNKEDTTVININIIEAVGEKCPYNSSQQMLLKRFKKELQYNSQHILIDTSTCKNGKTERTIEIYLKSRYFKKIVVTPNYTRNVNSGSYTDYRSSN